MESQRKEIKAGQTLGISRLGIATRQEDDGLFLSYKQTDNLSDKMASDMSLDEIADEDDMQEIPNDSQDEIEIPEPEDPFVDKSRSWQSETDGADVQVPTPKSEIPESKMSSIASSRISNSTNVPSPNSSKKTTSTTSRHETVSQKTSGAKMGSNSSMSSTRSHKLSPFSNKSLKSQSANFSLSPSNLQTHLTTMSRKSPSESIKSASSVSTLIHSGSAETTSSIETIIDADDGVSTEQHSDSGKTESSVSSSGRSASTDSSIRTMIS